MNSGKIVAGGRTDGWTEIEGSIRGPRGPKNTYDFIFPAQMKKNIPELRIRVGFVSHV